MTPPAIRRVRASTKALVKAFAERAPKRAASVFEHFEPFEGSATGADNIDFFGQITDPAYRHGVIRPTPPGAFRAEPPRVDSQYPEWVFLLESVRRATVERPGGPFVFGDLGAGWGPWLVTAKRALQQAAPGARVTLFGVEADPAHFTFLKEHLARNGVIDDELVLYRAAVYSSNGAVNFEVLDDPGGPYGQRVNDLGGAGLQVDGKTFATLTDGLDRMDYLTVDIQGGEKVLVESSIRDLTAKVRCLQIATHSRDIHRQVEFALRSAGWTKRFVFPFQRLVLRTSWGPIWFEDGSQAWLNPHLG